jgi:pyruvate dehydrogenase complex dehydrogenase (E1) component
VFSPTVASDEKWDFIKRQSLLADNKPLKKWLKEMKNKKQKENNDIVERANPTCEIAENYDTEKLVDLRIPDECFYSQYDEDTLEAVMDEQMKMVKLLKKCNKSKHLANRVLIIFDDLVGSSLFSGRRDNPFKKLNSNHR